MTHDFIDRRAHERIDAVQAIFIEVSSRGSRSESDNTIVRCETVDISMGGLRVFVPELIPAGSKLNIAVPLDGWKENLELVGEAMWVKQLDDASGYWVGLELMDTNRENMERWFKVVHSLSRK